MPGNDSSFRAGFSPFLVTLDSDLVYMQQHMSNLTSLTSFPFPC